MHDGFWKQKIVSMVLYNRNWEGCAPYVHKAL
jgi:hypothetical protein